MRAGMHWLAGVAVALAISISGAKSEPQAACPEHLPFGAPRLEQAEPITLLCRRGYALAHDDVRLVPRWTAELLRGAAMWSCGKRQGRFRPDPDLPRGSRAELTDYLRSGYDRGHMAPSGDMRDDAEAEAESFYLSNMAPQEHRMNAGQWAELEAKVRVWAVDRTMVWVLTGPIYEGQPRRLGGPNRLPVPTAFFKVVVDPGTHESISFIMPHRPLGSNMNIARFIVAPEVIERRAGFTLPWPMGGGMNPHATALWVGDEDAWQAAKNRGCAD